MIALVDANSFYCSCEQLFNPKLQGKEIVILSGGRSGCVISATRKAKNLGLKIGVPFFQIKDICKLHDIHPARVSFQRCSDMSARLMCFLDQLGFPVERYSVDEAFIHLPEIDRDWEVWAAEMKIECERLIGIPISIGLGATKTLAKLSSSKAKQGDGVFRLGAENLRQSLSQTPCSHIWMLGKSSAEYLKSHGIKTALQLIDFKYPERLYKKGRRFQQIREELLGTHHYDKEYESGKSMLNSRTHDEEFWTKEEVKKIWSLFIHKSSIRLRAKKKAARGITLFARTSYYQPNAFGFSVDCHIDQASNDARYLIEKSFESFESHDWVDAPYRKIGIVFWDTVPEDQKQLTLFDQDTDKMLKDQKLLKTLDSIYERFGELSIHAGSVEKPKSVSKRLSVEELPKAV